MKGICILFVNPKTKQGSFRDTGRKRRHVEKLKSYFANQPGQELIVKTYVIPADKRYTAKLAVLKETFEKQFKKGCVISVETGVGLTDRQKKVAIDIYDSLCGRNSMIRIM